MKDCPVLSEVRDVVHGMAQGDFAKTALAGGLLVMYAAPVGASIGKNSGFAKGMMMAKAGALSTAN